MKRYEVIYLGENTSNHKLEEQTLAIYDNRNVLLQTIKDMKKENIKIIKVYNISNNEIYKEIKF